MRILLIPVALSLAGCVDFNAPPPRVSVPPPDARSGPITRHSDTMLPIRQDEAQYAQAAQQPYDDEPLVSQQMPEQPQFVDAYRKVGSPKIALFVNRTLEGNIAKSDDAGANRGQPSGYERPQDGYLRSGQYDEADAKRVDYEAIENIMTDWLSCNGQVAIVSPTMARQRLSDQTVREMQQGRPQVLSEVAQQLGCDILIQVQAHPTVQTQEGLRVRLVAEALNIRDGLSVSRAVVDVEPPLEKTTINRYTRFMTRKLMDGMLGTWSAPPPGDDARGVAPPSTDSRSRPESSSTFPELNSTSSDASRNINRTENGPDRAVPSTPVAPTNPEVRTTPEPTPATPPTQNKSWLGSLLGGSKSPTQPPPSVDQSPSGVGAAPTTIQPPKVDPSLTAPPTTEPMRP